MRRHAVLSHVGQRLVNDEDGVVHHSTDENDEAEHRQHVQRTEGEEIQHGEPKETAERRQGHGEHDHHRVEEALEERRQEQVGDQHGEQEVPLQRLSGLGELVGASRQGHLVEPTDRAPIPHRAENLRLDDLHRRLQRHRLGRGHLNLDCALALAVVDLYRSILDRHIGH